MRPTADMDAGVDFDLVDGGVAPQGNAQVQVLGGSGDAGTIDVHYLTRATEIGLWLNTSPTSGAGTRTATFATLPESIRRSTDLYFVRGAEDFSTQWRHASLATYPSGALTLTLPASFAVTFAALATPYLRPTFDFAPVTSASKYVFNLEYSPAGNSYHRFDIELEPAAAQERVSTCATWAPAAMTARAAPATTCAQPRVARVRVLARAMLPAPARFAAAATPRRPCAATPAIQPGPSQQRSRACVRRSPRVRSRDTADRRAYVPHCWCQSAAACPIAGRSGTRLGLGSCQCAPRCAVQPAV